MNAVNDSRLKAICILDGRNKEKVSAASDYFSEYALMKYRVQVEIEYLIFLSENTGIIPQLTGKEKSLLKSFYIDFDSVAAAKIKEYEKKANHDVKAVEYYLKDSFTQKKLAKLVPYIHILLTSYDVNIPAYGLMLLQFKERVLILKLEEISDKIGKLAKSCEDMVMLGRTHGQPAVPTTMGKELAVYYYRLKKEMQKIKVQRLEGKLTGAVGNFNSFQFVYPQENWLDLSRKFISSLGLEPNIVTTQILPYDNWLALFDDVKRINYILTAFCQDIWWYISFDYFLQKKIEAEVGSSTMAHKINPITFENAEGNLLYANSQFEFFSRKLSASRLQRDLTDSTIKRDFGLAFGFTLLAWDSLMSGLGRITANPLQMEKDLDNHWEILSEAVQSYLRSKGKTEAYELLKSKTRGRNLNAADYYQLIDTLPIAPQDKVNLKFKSLKEYIGLAKEITKFSLKPDE